MSLTSAMGTGVSGLLANGEAVSVIGNNLANINTIGFKQGRTLFSDMLSSQIDNGQIGRGGQIQAVQNMFGQGSLETTGSATDLAIQGNAMFVVQDPNASAGQFFTRAGAFTFDKNQVLTNPDGFQVLGYSITGGVTAGTLSTIDLTKVAPPAGPPVPTIVKIAVNDKGVMSALYSDGTPVEIFQVALAKFPSTNGLDKTGGSLFAQTSASGAPIIDQTSFEGNKVISNSLEQSNVDMAEQLVKMITTQRAYTANSKTITASDQMIQDTLNIVR